MINRDDLVTLVEGEGEVWCLAKPGEVYVVCLTDGGATQLDLGDVRSAFTVRWFDPRDGGSLQKGSVEDVTGPYKVSLGLPPDERDKDWIVLVRRR